MTRLTRQLLASALLIATLAAVEWQIGWAHIASQLRQIPLPTLLGLTVLSLLSYVLRAWRIGIGFALKPLPLLLRISTRHNLLNILLPMRLGEASFPLLLKQHFQTPLTQASAGLLLFRLYDLAALLTAAGLIIGWIQGQLMLSLGCTAIGAALPIASNYACHHLNRLPKLGVLAQLPFSLPQHYLLWLTTLGLWLLKVSAFTLLIFNTSDLSGSTTVLGLLGAELSSVLPIHGFGGAGTYEAGFVLFADLSSHDLPALLAAAVQVHLYMLAIAVVFDSAAHLLIKDSRSQS